MKNKEPSRRTRSIIIISYVGVEILGRVKLTRTIIKSGQMLNFSEEMCGCDQQYNF